MSNNETSWRTVPFSSYCQHFYVFVGEPPVSLPAHAELYVYESAVASKLCLPTAMFSSATRSIDLGRYSSLARNFLKINYLIFEP